MSQATWFCNRGDPIDVGRLADFWRASSKGRGRRRRSGGPLGRVDCTIWRCAGLHGLARRRVWQRHGCFSLSTCLACKRNWIRACTCTWESRRSCSRRGRFADSITLDVFAIAVHAESRRVARDSRESDRVLARRAQTWRCSCCKPARTATAMDRHALGCTHASALAPRLANERVDQPRYGLGVDCR